MASQPTTPSSQSASVSSSQRSYGATTPSIEPAVAPTSPLLSLFRWVSTPSSSTTTTTSSPSLSGLSTPASVGTPTRTISEPAPLGLGSPALKTTPFGLPKLQRARSLDADPFKLVPAAEVESAILPPPSSASSKTSPSFRTFSVSSGLPVAEAQYRKPNSFLELLCKQDSFIGND